MSINVYFFMQNTNLDGVTDMLAGTVFSRSGSAFAGGNTADQNWFWGALDGPNAGVLNLNSLVQRLEQDFGKFLSPLSPRSGVLQDNYRIEMLDVGATAGGAVTAQVNFGGGDVQALAPIPGLNPASAEVQNINFTPMSVPNGTELILTGGATASQVLAISLTRLYTPGNFAQGNMAAGQSQYREVL